MQPLQIINNYFLSQFHICLHLFSYSRFVSEFAPDSHSAIKPVRVQVARGLHYVSNKFDV